MAKCLVFNKDACPDIKCPEGSFMGDDGVCYSCDEPESVKINCIGDNKILQICPNRYVSNGCGYYTVLFCAEGDTIINNHYCLNNFFY